MNENTNRLRRTISAMIIFFMAGLILSGLTAFPLETELKLVLHFIQYFVRADTHFVQWLSSVHKGVADTNTQYPFMAYGTDWLAFAHLVIAVAFVGPLRDPVKNIWVLEFGLVACVLIFPLAFVAGHARGIPLYWQLVDCSFGVFGGWLLVGCYRKTKKLKRLTQYETAS